MGCEINQCEKNEICYDTVGSYNCFPIPTSSTITTTVQAADSTIVQSNSTLSIPTSTISTRIMKDAIGADKYKFSVGGGLAIFITVSIGLMCYFRLKQNKITFNRIKTYK